MVNVALFITNKQTHLYTDYDTSEAIICLYPWGPLDNTILNLKI